MVEHPGIRDVSNDVPVEKSVNQCAGPTPHCRGGGGVLGEGWRRPISIYRIAPWRPRTILVVGGHCSN
jgi:hypothetical protein